MIIHDWRGEKSHIKLQSMMNQNGMEAKVRKEGKIEPKYDTDVIVFL